MHRLPSTPRLASKGRSELSNDSILHSTSCELGEGRLGGTTHAVTRDPYRRAYLHFSGVLIIVSWFYFKRSTRC